ncbi:MAG: ImmA/IrrE family metallo-endopeptidase [Clostridiales bacterium]|nr:ImmA/IrrE family metallo-endopeptidase [Clostridiales bacterium]
MLILSRQNIEAIGEAVLADCAMANVKKFSIPLNLEWFARRYLNLNVEYRKLSDDGTILGFTAYRGMNLKLPSGLGETELSVPKDTVFLDETLNKPNKAHSMRFTLAHECAHHILARIEEKRTGCSFRRRFDKGRQYTCRELRTAGDWCEWQANALAAVLLIPKSALSPYLTRWGRPFKLTSFGGYFNAPDYEIIKKLVERFNVSASVVKIRLKETGNLIFKLESEFCDPLDIIAG